MIACPLHDHRHRFVLRLVYALQLRAELAGLTDAQLYGAVAVGRSLGLEGQA